MVAANVIGFNQAWQTQANTRINAAAAMPSAASGAVTARSALTMADKIELMGVPQTQSNLEEESAADEIQLRLQQMTELAELSASDEIEDADRAGLQEETEALMSDIDRIAGSAGLTMAAAVEPSAQAEDTGAVPAASDITSHAQETGKPVLASWSGTLDPGDMAVGTTVTVNDITFEFVSGGATEPYQIDISDCTEKQVAQKFVDAINNQDIQKQFKNNWEIRESGSANDFKVSCSWTKTEAEGAAETWTLSFKQEGAEFQEGNGFLVRTGSTAKLSEPETFSSPDFKTITLGGIDKNNAQSGFVLKIDNITIDVNVQQPTFSGDAVVWDPRDENVCTLNVDADNMYRAADTAGSLANGLKQILERKEYFNCTPLVGLSGDKFEITVDCASIKSAPESMSIHPKATEPVGVVYSDAKENKAYLEFEVDLNELENGNSFNFHGMKFVFGEGVSDKDNHFVYIPIDKDHPDEMAKAFRKEFNDCFAVKAPPKTDEIAPSTGYISSGAAKTDKSRPWYENLEKLLAAGVFEMRCFIRDNNTAVFSIFARTEEVLNENGEIELDEDGGWKTAESPSDTPAEGETHAEGESSEKIGGSGSEPAALSTETLGVSSVNVATRAGAARAVRTLSAAGDKVSAVRTEGADSAEGSERLRDGGEAAQAVDEVKGQLEADSAGGVKAQSGKLEAGTALKLTQE